ncbi:hypothetical protein, partial [Actinoallomurus acaciae]
MSHSSHGRRSTETATAVSSPCGPVERGAGEVERAGDPRHAVTPPGPVGPRRSVRALEPSADGDGRGPRALVQPFQQPRDDQLDRRLLPRPSAAREAMTALLDRPEAPGGPRRR